MTNGVVEEQRDILDLLENASTKTTEDSKLFMNRPINPSFTKYGLFRNMVILPIVITSIIIIGNLIQAFSDSRALSLPCEST